MGYQACRPGVRRKALEAEGRRRAKGFAGPVEPKKDGTTALDSRNGAMVELWKQVAEPVAGGQGLEEASLASHARKFTGIMGKVRLRQGYGATGQRDAGIV